MSRKMALLRLTMVGVLSLGCVPSANAVLMVDQDFVTPNSDRFGVSSLAASGLHTVWQQSVTSNISGILGQIDIFYAGDFNYTGVAPSEVGFFVNLGSSWQDDANDFEMLLSLEPIMVIPAGRDPIRITIDLLRDDDIWDDIRVEADQVFVIGLQPANDSAVMPSFSGSGTGDSYPSARGNLWLNRSLQSGGISDLSFVTFVDVGVRVPEPSVLVLLLLGLPGLIVVRVRHP